MLFGKVFVPTAMRREPYSESTNKAQNQLGGRAVLTQTDSFATYNLRIKSPFHLMGRLSQSTPPGPHLEPRYSLARSGATLRITGRKIGGLWTSAAQLVQHSGRVLGRKSIRVSLGVGDKKHAEIN